MVIDFNDSNHNFLDSGDRTTMNSPDIGEQAISKAAEVGLESQLDEADELDVDVRTNPADLMQGEIDSVSVKGEGLVMQQELRAEKIRIETGDIDINPIKAALGNIELESPSDARMLVVLKEEDIQRAFDSDYVMDKLQNLKIAAGGEKTTANINKVKFQLPEENKVSLEADIELTEQNRQEQINFSAVPEVSSDGTKINLNSVEYEHEAEHNQEIARAVIDSAEEILDLRNFELEEMSMRVRKLDVRLGKLTIEADDTIADFPDA